MKLWLLQPVTPWVPWYDKAFGFVVRASTEEKARWLASTQAGDEGCAVWLDAKQTTCVELVANGKQDVILRDFAAA